MIDGATNAVTAQISLPFEPLAVAADSASDDVFAFSVPTAATAAVIDGATNQVTASISLPSGFNPAAAAVNPITDLVYVTGYGGTILVINGSTDTLAATISLADPTLDPSPGATGMAVDTVTDMIYVYDADGPQVDVIDGATNTVTGRIALPASSRPPFAIGIAVDAAAGLVYAPDFGNFTGESGSISVINTATGGVSTLTSGLADPYVLALDASNDTLYAVCPFSPGVGTTYVIDTASGVVTDQIPRGGSSAALAPASDGSLYITSSMLANATDRYATVVTPSTVNTMSPVIDGGVSDPAVALGQAVQDQLGASATPAATFSATDLPAGLTLSPSGLLAGTPTAVGTYQIPVTAANGVAPPFTRTVSLTVYEAPVIMSAYTPVGPVRVLDTRNGTGVPQAPVGPGGTVSLQVTGVGGVPATGVTAVVLNVTATDTTASSYVTVYPDGQTRPTASNLNVTAGETIANLVTVPVGSDGMVDFYNNAGSTDLVADLAGYYTSTGTGSLCVPAGPVRVLDTRNGTGVSQAPVGPGGTISLQVTGVDGVPASGVTAVVLNVTATDPTAASYVTVWPDGSTRPTASSLNFTAGETIPNLVVVPVGADGVVDFYNHAGSTDLVADLAGYYTSSGTGSMYVPVSTVRVLDTRNGTGGYSSPVGPGAIISLPVDGVAGVPATGVTAVILNVTATDPTASSYVTVYPDGSTQPTASSLNFTAGETIPNLVVVPVGTDGAVDFYNNTGSVDLVADLAGYFVS